MSHEELKFASEDEAFQYLADLTGQQVRVAGLTDKENKLNKIVKAIVLPVISKELHDFEFERFNIDIFFYGKDITKEVLQMFLKSEGADKLIKLGYLSPRKHLRPNRNWSYNEFTNIEDFHTSISGTNTRVKGWVKVSSDASDLSIKIVSDISGHNINPRSSVKNTVKLSVSDPDLKNKVIQTVQKLKQDLVEHLQNFSLWSSNLKDLVRRSKGRNWQTY